MGDVKRFLEKSLETTGTRFFLGHDFRATLLSAVSPLPETNDKGLAVFSTVANEMFFLPAWLEHHRGLGVEHFYILVDRSEDGTIDFLTAQSDVTTMTSEYGFGSSVNISPLSKLGHKRFTRAGSLYKRIITDFLFEGQWALYLDADEFLMIPPGFENIQELIDSVDGKTSSIPASNVIFYPERFSNISQQRPAVFEDLVKQAPYFDSLPLLQSRRGKWPTRVGPEKTAKLIYQFLREKSGGTLKTPLMKHGKTNYRMGSHVTSEPPGTEHILALAHFVFSANTVSKIERAKSWNSYYNQSASYKRLDRLIEVLNRHDHSLLDETSTQYRSNSQLVSAGLINWPYVGT